MDKISVEKAAMDQSLFEIRVLLYYYFLVQEKTKNFRICGLNLKSRQNK